MTGLLGKLKNVFSRAPAPSMDELRAVFKRRYQAFKMLLAANNTALQLMSDMESAAYGNYMALKPVTPGIELSPLVTSKNAAE